MPGGAVGRALFNLLLSEIVAIIGPDAARDPALPHALTETVWASIHGLSSLAIDVPDYPTSGIETCLDEAVNMVLAGISHHGPGGTVVPGSAT